MKFDFLAHREEPAFEVFRQVVDIAFKNTPCSPENITKLSPEARLVYLLWSLDGQIHNGGFQEFFFEAVGAHCHEMLEHLQTIGANNSYALLKEAIGYFPDGHIPTDQIERISTWRKACQDTAINARLDEMNNKFYAYEDNLAGLLDEYVSSHGEAMVCSET